MNNFTSKKLMSADEDNLKKECKVTVIKECCFA